MRMNKIKKKMMHTLQQDDTYARMTRDQICIDNKVSIT